MTYALVWSWVAEHHDIFTLRVHAAEQIAVALLRLAETGRGRIVQVSPDEPNRFRLRVHGAEARLFIDRKARTIFVMRVYRR